MISQKNVIVGLLTEFDSDKLRDLWNKYCNNVNPDDYIYYNDEYAINEIFNGNPYEAIRATQYGEYSFTDEYFIINTYNNLTSFGCSELTTYINLSELADYVMDNPCEEISQEISNELNEVWYEDLQYDFLRYFNQKYNTTIDTEDYERIPEDVNLVTEDWDTIADEHFDEICK